MDAATRKYARQERSRLTMLRLRLRPDGRSYRRGPVGRPGLRDSHEAWEAEVEAAIAAYEKGKETLSVSA